MSLVLQKSKGKKRKLVSEKSGGKPEGKAMKNRRLESLISVKDLPEPADKGERYDYELCGVKGTVGLTMHLCHIQHHTSALRRKQTT